MDHRAIKTIESDIATIQKFASSYRAYWGVTTGGNEREPVKDRVALRHRLHRQLPGVEKIMARANTNGFGFGPPPIARGAPPRLGIVAVAFADEDPVYSVGGGPPCFEEVLNRLEMTLGVLDTELKDAKSGAGPAQRPTVPRGPNPDPMPNPQDAAAVSHAAVPVEVVEAPEPGAGAARVFFRGLRKAWTDARDARRAGRAPSLESRIAITAGVVTIVGTLGAVFGWWSP